MAECRGGHGRPGAAPGTLPQITVALVPHRRESTSPRPWTAGSGPGHLPPNHRRVGASTAGIVDAVGQGCPGVEAAMDGYGHACQIGSRNRTLPVESSQTAPASR